MPVQEAIYYTAMFLKLVLQVRIHVLIPYSIFAVAAFIACVLCLTLPETNNEPTKEIFEPKTPKRNVIGVDNIINDGVGSREADL